MSLLRSFRVLHRSALLDYSHRLRTMTSQAAISKLPSPLKELVLSAVKADDGQAFGTSEKEKAEVADWIEKVAAGDVAKAETLKELETQLVPRTYAVGNSFTAADVALYGALHPVLSQLQPSQYFSHPAVTRYFDHIQSQPSVRTSAEAIAPAFSLVTIDLTDAPKLERKPDPPKEKKKKDPAASDAVASSADAPAGKTAKKEKKAATQAIADGSSAAADTGAPAPVEKPADAPEKAPKAKKEKKPADAGAPAEGGKKKGGAAPAKAAADDAGEPAPSMIDLRIGRIVEIQKHPDADSLYVEQIDFGEETGPRTVVSGLVNYIPIDQMRDRYLIGVCNLKPVAMRGVKSFAMVLCATSKEGKEGGIELVRPPEGSQPGDRVFFDGADYESATPLAQMNPKKKIFETIQPGFTTLDSKEAAWVNPATQSVHRIRTARGVCVAPTFVGASLS